jgi:hypothetical protein
MNAEIFWQRLRGKKMEEKVCCSLHGHCDIEKHADCKKHCGPHDKTNLCRGERCPETTKQIGPCLTISEWKKKWADHNDLEAMKGGQSINYKGNAGQIIAADNFPPQEIVDAAVKVENWMNTYAHGDWALCGIERRGMGADEIEQLERDVHVLTMGHTELRQENDALIKRLHKYGGNLWEVFKNKMTLKWVKENFPLTLQQLPAFFGAVIEKLDSQLQHYKIESADKERKLQWEKDRALRAEEEVRELTVRCRERGEAINKNYGYGKKMEAERDAALEKIDALEHDAVILEAMATHPAYLEFSHNKHRIYADSKTIADMRKWYDNDYKNMKGERDEAVKKLAQVEAGFKIIEETNGKLNSARLAALEELKLCKANVKELQHKHAQENSRAEHYVKELQHKHSQENQRAEHYKNENTFARNNLAHITALWEQQKKYLDACYKKIREYEKELTRRGAAISGKARDEEIKIPEKLTLKIKPFKDREAQSFYLGKKQYLGNDLEEWVKEILRLLCQLSGEISNATGYKTWGNTLVMDRFTLQLITKIFPLTDFEMVNNSNFRGVLLGKYLVYISDLMENEIQISYQQPVGRN